VLSLDDLDAGVEVDTLLVAHSGGEPDATSSEIGLRVAARVPDGAKPQAGIGAVPDAALAGLSDHRDLRVWTEMFSDGVMALEMAGALDTSVPFTASFVFGSPQLHDWLDGNARVAMARTERTNSPALIASQRAMTLINTGCR
jgi:acyl-CoA hydrolase